MQQTSSSPRRHRVLRSIPALALGACLAAGLVGCSGDAEPDAGSKAAAARASTLVDRGAAQLQSGDATGARTTLKEAVRLDPDNVFGHYDLGLIAQQGGSTLEAVTHYAAAIRLDPEYVPALNNLAILTEGQDLRGAAALWKRVVDLKPGDATAKARLRQVQKRLAASR